MEINPEVLRHAIEVVCNRLTAKFRFGYHDLEDMRQEAYVLALEALAAGKYDESRPLTTFLYVHIHNRLYNFKRKHYARLTPPCHRCPLMAFNSSSGVALPGGGYCGAFRDLGDCSLYSGWFARNEAKKSLAHVAECGDPAELRHDPPDNDYLDWIYEQLPPEHQRVFQAAREGRRVNRNSLKNIIAYIHENIELEFSDD